MPDQPQPRCTPGQVEGHADGRLSAAAAQRNEQPIIEALEPHLADQSGLMLEIGSGTGQHISALSRAFPALDWQPSDPFDTHLDSIRAWVGHTRAPNLRAPIWLDAAEPWPQLEPLTGVISVNVIHIAPWVVAKGIVSGAAERLSGSGILIFYGPFKEGGAHTGEGNAAFDARLRAEDPAWGIRDLDDLAALAERHGFASPLIVPMPANNRLVLFRKR